MADNPALLAAARSGTPVVPLFIEGWDDDSSWRPGAASRWWQARSPQRLATHLRELGLPLVVRPGPAERVLAEAAGDCATSTVYANRLPTPTGEESERRAAAVLGAQGRRLELTDERYLFDWRRLDAGRKRPYLIFTPFWKACLRLGDPPRPAGTPEHLRAPRTAPHGLAVDALVEARAWARFAEARQGFRKQVWASPRSSGAPRPLRPPACHPVLRPPRSAATPPSLPGQCGPKVRSTRDDEGGHRGDDVPGRGARSIEPRRRVMRPAPGRLAIASPSARQPAFPKTGARFPYPPGVMLDEDERGEGQRRATKNPKRQRAAQRGVRCPMQADDSHEKPRPSVIPAYDA